MRTSIWLVRHGQTEANQARRYLSSGDSPLTPFGRRQCAALAWRLRRLPFTAALVSPYDRTRATAAAILAGRAIAPIEDERWREIDHGRWEGLTYREVCARFPEEARTRFADPLHGRVAGGESLAEAAGRVAEGWAALMNSQPGARILVVTHATPVQLVLCMLNGMEPTQHWRWRIDLGSVTAIECYSGGTIVRMVNEVPRQQLYSNEQKG